jgi:hypothetical protein
MINCFQFCFNFTFKFNVRRYMMATTTRTYSDWLTPPVEEDWLDSDWMTPPLKEDVARMLADISASFPALFLGARLPPLLYQAGAGNY